MPAVNYAGNDNEHIEFVAKEGEELELSAAVKDIEDGNMVTLQVFFKGQDPAVHVALAQIPAIVEGGSAKGTWKYQTYGDGIPPSSDPAFFFSAHSAWCPMKKSGDVEIGSKISLDLTTVYSEANDNFEIYILLPNREDEKIDMNSGVVSKNDLIPGEYRLVAKDTCILGALNRVQKKDAVVLMNHLHPFTFPVSI